MNKLLANLIGAAGVAFGTLYSQTGNVKTSGIGAAMAAAAAATSLYQQPPKKKPQVRR